MRRWLQFVVGDGDPVLFLWELPVATLPTLFSSFPSHPIPQLQPGSGTAALAGSSQNIPPFTATGSTSAHPPFLF